MGAIFAGFGLPEVVVTDNGTGVTSSGFQEFIKHNKIKHHRSNKMELALCDNLIGFSNSSYVFIATTNHLCVIDKCTLVSWILEVKIHTKNVIT